MFKNTITVLLLVQLKRECPWLKVKRAEFVFLFVPNQPLLHYARRIQGGGGGGIGSTTP